MGGNWRKPRKEFVDTSFNPMSLSAKRVLLFGDSCAMNKTIAECLQKLGAEVVVFYDEAIEELETALPHFLEHKDIDGFVFSVVHSEFKPIRFVKPGNVTSLMKDNYGLFIEVLRVLSKSRLLKHGSSVVALSSISSVRGMKTKTVFCSAKAALDAAVRCLALELGEKRIRVNSIQKGYVNTDFVKDSVKTATSVRDGDDAVKSILGVTDASEIANLTAFLLGDAAPTITGTSFVIDGGYTA